MKYFVDTEFIEDGKTIDLISIGIVAENGDPIYLVNKECEFSKASDWVKENVLAHLNQRAWWEQKTKREIATEILAWIDDDKPEFWGYYCDYDWVAICQLFGTMMDLPKGWPMFMYDLRQWLNHKGLSHISQPDDMPHHALSDARWIAETYKKYEVAG